MSGMSTTLNAGSAARLEAYLHRYIPLVGHMQVHVAACDASGLTLTAPLSANINHQSTAFGGSLASLATLACWGLTWLLLEKEPDTHIVVNESHMLYLHPVTEMLVAHCPLPSEVAQQDFFATFQRRGKGRLELKAHILQGKTLCARFSGSFVRTVKSRTSQTETLLLPRPLVNQLLHAAQLHPLQTHWGIIAAHDGNPGDCHSLGQGIRPTKQAIRAMLDSLAENREKLWAVYRSDPDAAAAPTAAELALFGTPLFLTVSLATKGVLQLKGWRLDSPGVLELGIAIREPQI